MISIIENVFNSHENVLKKSEILYPQIEKIANLCKNAFESGNKILVCGNGGSAADSQHIAAEFVARYSKNRKSLPAVALTTDTSILTAISNDYEYNCVFSRQVESIGNSGDVLIGISTSGQSKSVINAINTANKNGIKTVAFTGKNGKILENISDISLVIPSDITARIQEMHILCAHIICEIIDEFEW